MPFRWSYIIAPLVILLLSLILVAVFYRLLPAEVAVRFDLEGNPETWLGRGATIAWMLLPQFLLVLLAAGVAWGAGKLDAFRSQADSGIVSPGRMIVFMGNIIALPQLIIFFAMVDILGYNSYQTHFLPMWIVWLAILVLATLALAAVGVWFIFRARRAMS